MPALKEQPSAFAAPDPSARAARLREQVRQEAGDKPGVYRMLADDGEVLYVGKSKRVRSRLLSYFRLVYPDDKGARLIRETAQLEWEYVPNEFSALLTELRFIKKLRPRFNHMLKRDARNFAFIRIPDVRAPRLMIVRGGVYERGSVYYGPFHGAVRVGEAVRELNDVLGLRDCALDRRMHFSDQSDLFGTVERTPGCVRFEIGRCCGPCIGAVSSIEYLARLQRAKDFLDGGSDEPLAILRARMEESSAALDFERAAVWRDKLERLEMLRSDFDKLRHAVESLSFVYAVPGTERDRVYVVRRGQVRLECDVPQTAAASRELVRTAGEVFSSASPSVNLAMPAHEIDELLLLSSWFRQKPDELRRTCSVDELQRRGGAVQAIRRLLAA